MAGQRLGSLEHQRLGDGLVLQTNITAFVAARYSLSLWFVRSHAPAATSGTQIVSPLETPILKAASGMWDFGSHVGGVRHSILRYRRQCKQASSERGQFALLSLCLSPSSASISPRFLSACSQNYTIADRCAERCGRKLCIGVTNGNRVLALRCKRCLGPFPNGIPAYG